jgi:hypothetical protein
LWCGTHDNFTGAVATFHVMVQCAAFTKLNADHLTFGLLGCFADRLRNFLGFTFAETDTAFLIAYNHESCEAETLTTLNGLGHTVDRYEAILKFWVFVTTITAALIWFTSHVALLDLGGTPR